jgi:hypothetical protein
VQLILGGFKLDKSQWLGQSISYYFSGWDLLNLKLLLGDKFKHILKSNLNVFCVLIQLCFFADDYGPVVIILQYGGTNFDVKVQD